MIYLDTSVALLALLRQPGARRAERLIVDAWEQDGLISSRLLEVEMLRAAHREGLDAARARGLRAVLPLTARLT